MSKPYSIGSDHLPGLSKLVEEAGEVVQAGGKIVGFGGFGQHWDGQDLRQALSNEIADVMAACLFFMAENNLDADAIHKRRDEKLDLFCKWHRREQASKT